MTNVSLFRVGGPRLLYQSKGVISCFEVILAGTSDLPGDGEVFDVMGENNMETCRDGAR